MMWFTANWSFVALGVVAIAAIVFLVMYLSSRAERVTMSIGAGPVNFSVDIRNNNRHITKEDFDKVDLNLFYVDSNIGFVIRQPFSPDWVVERDSITKLWQEKGFTEHAIKILDEGFLTENPHNDTCVTFITQGPKQSVKYAAGTVINGRPLQVEVIDEVEKIFVDGEEQVYDQILIVAIRKDACKFKLGLLELFLQEAALGGNLGPKRLGVNPENTVFLLDYSATFQNIEYNGQRGDHVINNTFLLQENRDYFFEIFVTYVQAGNKPPEVWNKLTGYLDSFRVLA